MEQNVIILTKGRCKGHLLVCKDINVEKATYIMETIDSFSVSLLEEDIPFICEDIKFLRESNNTIIALPIN